MQPNVLSPWFSESDPDLYGTGLDAAKVLWLRETGTICTTTDPATTALIVTAFGLAQFLLGDRFAQSLGADPASPEGASRLTVPALEFLAEGLYATPSS